MTKEEIIEMAEKVYGKCDWHGSALAHLEQFAKLIAEHEREACAVVAHQWSKREDDVGGYIEAAIRARGEKE